MKPGGQLAGTSRPTIAQVCPPSVLRYSSRPPVLILVQPGGVTRANRSFAFTCESCSRKPVPGWGSDCQDDPPSEVDSTTVDPVSPACPENTAMPWLGSANCIVWR